MVVSVVHRRQLDSIPFQLLPACGITTKINKFLCTAKIIKRNHRASEDLWKRKAKGLIAKGKGTGREGREEKTVRVIRHV